MRVGMRVGMRMRMRVGIHIGMRVGIRVVCRHACTHARRHVCRNTLRFKLLISFLGGQPKVIPHQPTSAEYRLPPARGVLRAQIGRGTQLATRSSMTKTRTL